MNLRIAVRARLEKSKKGFCLRNSWMSFSSCSDRRMALVFDMADELDGA